MEVKDFNQLFIDANKSLCSVESFTGGLFASSITKVSGASKFFKGALVTYATEEKENLLKISKEDIEKHGVVSGEIASQMAYRGMQLLNTDYCVSFTGNAGPEAMEEKPVGEVYIGLATGIRVEVYGLKLKGTREEIQKQAVDFAIKQLSIMLKNNK